MADVIFIGTLSLPRDKSEKHMVFMKMLFPGYQSNSIEKCLVSLPTCSISFSHLLGFNRIVCCPPIRSETSLINCFILGERPSSSQ